MRRTSVISLSAISLIASACIGSPSMMLLDRKTVLEEQASGELHPLENDLREAAIVPQGADFTRAELREAGADVSEATLSRIVQIHGQMRTDADELDELLVRRCIGEAETGLLVETPRSCAGRTNEARVSSAVQRVNRGRRQLWRYLHERRPDAAESELRERWRERHLASVVCGGQIQTSDGAWEVKRCSD